jgi:energy-coupling factor transporter ATP-binding protein EcfA2
VQQSYGERLFRSLWGVPSDKASYIDENGSLSGYDGPLLLPEIVLDVDGPTLQAAQDVMLECVRTLREGYGVPDRAIQVWFSGGKGYHLHLPSGLMPTTDPPTLKEWVTNTFGRLCAKKEQEEAHLDVSLLGDATKLIRVPWSHHEKTGCYKTPIHPSDRTADPGAHATWASSPEDHIEKPHPPFEASVEPLTATKPDPEAGVSNTLEAANVRSERAVTSSSSNNSGDNGEEESPKPHYITCMHHLAERGPIEGRRHDDMLRMAAANAYRGLSKSEIEAALKDWLHAPGKGLPLDDHGKQDAADMARRATGQHPNGDGERWDRFQCSDEVMSEFCDSTCIFYKYREQEDPVATDQQRTQATIDYITASQEDGIDVGTALGSSSSCLIQPTEIATLYGNTGLGKTALMQSIALAHPHLKVLDISSEMSVGAQETRYLQIKRGLARDPGAGVDEVKAILEEEGEEALHNAREEASSHIDIMTRAPDLSDLERHIHEQQADVLILDTVGKLHVGGEGHKDAIRSIYKTLTNLANRLDLIVLCVRHIRKSGMDQYVPGLQEVKGYKEILEESDFVFAFGGESDSTVRKLELRKCNRPVEFETWLQGNPDTFRFRAVTRKPDSTPQGDSAQGDSAPDKSVSTDDVSVSSNLPS